MASVMGIALRVGSLERVKMFIEADLNCVHHVDKWNGPSLLRACRG
jgi:hypothetical protein